MVPLVVKDPLIGRVIAGKYEIIRRLGAGGMGAVYHARHTQTGGDVAVKFLHQTAVGDETAVRRFQLEAKNAAALRHTNTIRVTDFGVDEGLLYLVMEYLEGLPLSDVLQRDGPMPWRRVVRIVTQVLKSLWEAHEHKSRIIHRDIKPANIFVVDLPGETDHVRVLDFGISRALDGSGAGTQGLLGTPYYMAPELWRGERVDARADLYALGCVTYQMLVGAPPFVPPPSASDSIFPLFDMHLNVPPPELATKVDDVPAPIATWVATMLAKDQAQRPSSARAALEALERAAADAEAEVAEAEADEAPPPRSKTPSKPIRAPLPVTDTITADRVRGPPNARSVAATPSAQRSRKWVLPVALAVVGVLAAVVVVVMTNKSPAPTPEQPTSEPGLVTHDPWGAPEDPVPVPPPAPVKTELEPLPTYHSAFGPMSGSYRARLSSGDHVDDDGEDLLRASEVLVRDRERYHTGRGDSEDWAELFLVDPNVRMQAAALFERFIDPTTAHSILTGTPLVEVGVYQSGLIVRCLSN